jgi:hypothetical protein
MPDLAQRFLCDIEFDGNKLAHLAHLSKQIAITDEVRPPRPDERGAIDQSRDTLCVAIAAIITATIALAVILGSYQSRSTPSDQATIEAINVNALVERIIKVESNGIRTQGTNFPAPQGLVNFLMTHGLKPSESIAAI